MQRSAKGRWWTLLIESSKPLTVRLRSGTVHLEPGRAWEFTEEDGLKLLVKAKGKVRLVNCGPVSPLQPGWLVVYRDRAGTLCGGCDERQHGTVQGCRWDGSAWTVTLTDGQMLPLRAILSVGKTDAAGRVVAAWTARTHGYDGEGTR